VKLAQQIKNHGEKIGLDDLKITAAGDLKEVHDFLQQRRDKDQLSKFVKDDLDLITNPKQVLSTAKSIIVVALSYYHEGEKKRGALQGGLAKFAQVKDYHQVLGDKLEQLADFIEGLAAGVETYQFVDTGPTVDRALARKAGLGWQGKNCSIIHPEYGSWIFIGGIMTNLELDKDPPLENKCGDCTLCLDKCPTGALEEKYVLNAEKCLGQVTLSKGYLSIAERKKIGTRVWGCDTCQNVCPYNQEVKTIQHAEFKTDNLEAHPKLLPLLKLTNQQFRDKFNQTVMNWRGKRPIKRNAAIILGNLKAQAAVTDLICTLKNDPQAIVRGHAAWALGEIGTLEATQGLKEGLVDEEDEKVKSEIQRALNV